MINKYLQIALCLFLLHFNVSAQFEFSVATDKDSYDYGETIYISSTLKNISDSSQTIIFSNSSSCQAEFQLDDNQSGMWTICSPATQEVTISPGSSRIYSWTIDPKKYGIPISDGIHLLNSYIYYRYPPYFGSPKITHTDTIYFEAPKFIGGQLWITFTQINDSLLIPLRDSLDVIVIDRWESLFSDSIHELWQIYGYQIDSLASQLQQDNRFKYVEFNRQIQYDSIYVTSVQQEPQQITDFYLSNAYPNPFNATSRFYVEIPRTDQVNIFLYNILGETVATIFSGTLSSNMKYTFEIDANNLASGIYYYSVMSSIYQKSKKVVLLN